MKLIKLFRRGKKKEEEDKDKRIDTRAKAPMLPVKSTGPDAQTGKSIVVSEKAVPAAPPSAKPTSGSTPPAPIVRSEQGAVQVKPISAGSVGPGSPTTPRSSTSATPSSSTTSTVAAPATKPTVMTA